MAVLLCKGLFSPDPLTDFFAAGPLIFCACSQCPKFSELFAESIVVIIDRLGLGNPNFFCIALQQTIEGPVS
jgi:hypothetical protein